jgi:hypothetical protein
MCFVQFYRRARLFSYTTSTVWFYKVQSSCLLSGINEFLNNMKADFLLYRTNGKELNLVSLFIVK